MKNKRSPLGVFRRLQALYARMDQAYNEAATGLEFTCKDCADNCCTSFFQHHTYVEWAYLWKGLEALPAPRREAYLARAAETVRLYREAIGRGERPKVMCPLNDEGLCGVYEHRLMICRLHGTANSLTRPDGRRAVFPGCFRYQEATRAAGRPEPEPAPYALDIEAMVPLQGLDRTPLYRDLAMLEVDFLGGRRDRLSKVDLTLAEMLVYGPPNTRDTNR
jgi:Fe-S-cluster containining protein